MAYGYYIPRGKGEIIMTKSPTEHPNEMNKEVKGGYVSVNGLEMYYEIHGTGKPLVLLHGGLETIGVFEQVLPSLAESRQVIRVELQGHGHTADINRPLSFEAMADDLAALIQHLGLEKADLMGYSLGGGVALQTAFRHPELVRKLVIVSTPFKRDGWYPEVRAGLDSINAQVGKTWIGSPMYQAYAAVAPKPDDWLTLVGKLGQLVGQDYDWSQAVAALKAPTMIVVGDADAVRPAHAVEFFELLGGGQHDAGWDGSGMSNARLAILPGVTHYNIFSAPVLASTVTPFLDAPLLESGATVVI
jgi:pimeloyl-ACP methyl ester carboxylesterase